jgi:hypothetical protein
MTGIVVIYFIIALSPFWIPGIVAYYQRSSVPCPWMFICSVSCITYGVFTLFIFVIGIPAEAYIIFIAPQLQAAGLKYGRSFIEGVNFFEGYAWIILPVSQLALAYIVTRKLGRKWSQICVALKD